MYGYFPEPYNNSSGVKRILTCDWLSRKNRHWPLVPSHLIQPHYQTHPNSLDPHQALHNLPSTPPPSLHPLRSLNYIISSLYNLYPSLKPILEKHHGKVAVCGGLLSRLLSGMDEENCDCDIFFYGTGSEEVSPGMVGEYREILEDCVGIIGEMEESLEGVYVERLEHVVNVHVGANKERGYQFILRVYPRIDMIIGGFDIGASMIAFDGLNLWCTPLGAWSLAKRAVIVDTTRRSSSFEYRLEKYMKLGFGVVFPGLDVDAVFAGASLNNHFNIRIEKWKVEGCEVKIWNKRYDIKKKIDLDDKINKLSDYGSYNVLASLMGGNLDAIDNYYATIMKLGWRDKLFVVEKLPHSYERAREVIAAMIDRPQFFRTDLESFLVGHTQSLQQIPELNDGYLLINPKTKYRLFAEYFEEFEELMNSFCEGEEEEREMEDEEDIRESDIYNDFISKVTYNLNKRITKRSQKWAEEFRGLKWITKNPGTQHTASINPIMEDPRKFYLNCYRPFIIGLPKGVEYCIWVFFHGQLNFPSEIVRLIVRLVVERNNLFFYSKATKTLNETGEKSKKRKIDEDFEKVKKIKASHNEEPRRLLAPMVLLREKDKILPFEQSLKLGLRENWNQIFFDLNISYAESLWERNSFGFTKEEALSIYFYTFEYPNTSRSINHCLNKDLSSPLNYETAPKWRFYLHYFFPAIQKLPKVTGTLYWATKEDLYQNFPQGYLISEKIVWNTFTSTSKCLESLQKSFQKEDQLTIFELTSITSARSITVFSAIPREEILVPPGTTFEVLSTWQDGKTVFIKMKQIPTLDKMLKFEQ